MATTFLLNQLVGQTPLGGDSGVLSSPFKDGAFLKRSQISSDKLRDMSFLRRLVDKAVRLTALAGIGYLLVSIVVTFVTRSHFSLSPLKPCKCLKPNFNRLVPELIIGTRPNSSLR